MVGQHSSKALRRQEPSWEEGEQTQEERNTKYQFFVGRRTLPGAANRKRIYERNFHGKTVSEDQSKGSQQKQEVWMLRAEAKSTRLCLPQEEKNTKCRFFVGRQNQHCMAQPREKEFTRGTFMGRRWVNIRGKEANKNTKYQCFVWRQINTLFVFTSIVMLWEEPEAAVQCNGGECCRCVIWRCWRVLRFQDHCSFFPYS